MSRMALELLQTLMAKRLSTAVVATDPVVQFDRVRAGQRAGRSQMIIRNNSLDLSGGAIAVLTH